MSIFKKEKYSNLTVFKIPAATYSRLSIHIFSSPHGVDWKSPKNLFISNLKNLFSSKNRNMGHMAAEIQVVEKDGTTSYYEFTGMTDTKKKIFDKLFIQKVGLGMLFCSFPGRLERTNDLITEMSAKRKSGRVQTVTFLLSEENAKNLERYLKEYREYAVDKVYGGFNYRPRYKEGAGCVYFVESLVEIAGLSKEPIFNNWEKKIQLPSSLVGGKYGGKKVGLAKMFMSKDFYLWPKESDPKFLIRFWDPDTIFKSIQGQDNSQWGKEILFALGSKELIIDRTTVTHFETKFWLD